MASPPRVKGNVLVVGVVSLTLAAVGYGTVYLPFYADRERLRGVRTSERRIPEGARKEILAHLQKEEAHRRELESQLAAAPPEEEPPANLPKKASDNKQSKSMWKMLDFSSKQQKPPPTKIDENTPLWKVFEEQQKQLQRQEEEGADDGPGFRPDQFKLSDKARSRIMEAIKASEDEDRRQAEAKAASKKN
jgi:hypothetical protein